MSVFEFLLTLLASGFSVILYGLIGLLPTADSSLIGSAVDAIQDSDLLNTYLGWFNWFVPVATMGQILGAAAILIVTFNTAMIVFPSFRNLVTQFLTKI